MKPEYVIMAIREHTMSPIAHTAMGIWGWRGSGAPADMKTWLLFVAMANLPDFDFLLKLLPFKSPYLAHQLFTHNIFFVSLTTAAGFFFLKEWRQRLALGLVGFSHLLLDFATIDWVPPIGIRLFYPFSAEYFNGGFFPNMVRGGLDRVFSLHNFITLTAEITVFVLPLFFIYRTQWRTR